MDGDFFEDVDQDEVAYFRAEALERVQDYLALKMGNSRNTEEETGGGLILTRNIGARIMIGDNITVTVLGIKGCQTRLQINAPKEIAVHREEVYNRIKQGITR